MAKFIELHDEKNRAVLVNVEDILLVIEIYESKALTSIKMRDGSMFKALESEKTVLDKLKNIR